MNKELFIYSNEDKACDLRPIFCSILAFDS